MEERTIHLKIKIKSLVDEARSIRKEANSQSGMVKWRLNQHRTEVVRPHARKNLLAYGIINGVSYCAMEKKCNEPPNFQGVAAIAKRFGATDEAIDAWVQDAKAYLRPMEQAA